MSIGALFHTHICPDAVIGLEENQALLCLIRGLRSCLSPAACKRRLKNYGLFLFLRKKIKTSFFVFLHL